MHNATDVIIVSIGLFLRQNEAVNLLVSNITPATDPNTGMPIMTTEGLLHCLVVTIRQRWPGISCYCRMVIKQVYIML